MKKRVLLLVVGIFLLVFFVEGVLVKAANLPLEIIYPHDSASSDARHKWAYPGIEYNIRLSAIRGAYPYTWELITSPSGMNVDPTTGEVTWIASSSGSYDVSARLTDSENTVKTVSWTIAVDPNKFIFFDDGYSGTMAGSINQPYEDIGDWWQGDATTQDVGKFLYFRGGSYDLPDYSQLTLGQYSVIYDVRLYNNRKPVVWMGYPGETATISMALSGDKWGRLYFNGVSNGYVDNLGFTGTNCYWAQIKAGYFQTVFRRLTFNQLSNVNNYCDSTNNEAYIRFLNEGSHFNGKYHIIQDNVFNNVDKGSAIKVYITDRLLIEDNIFTDVSTSECVSLKSSVVGATVRGNVFDNIANEAIGGGQSDFYVESTRDVEICYNNVKDGNPALIINRNGGVENMYVYRNTLQGDVGVKHEDGGPTGVVFSNNVIVNDGGGVIEDYDGGSGGWSESISPNHNLKALTGTANLDASTGKLQNDWAQYVGSKGWQLEEYVTPCICISPEICCNSQCISPPSCPDCNDQDPCTTDLCIGQGTCYPSCQNSPLTSCINNDNCCPSGCNPGNDNDCSECQVAADCPDQSCQTKACTNNICVYNPVGCVNNDGCCPSGCTATNDDDCSSGGTVTETWGDSTDSDHPGTVQDTYINVGNPSQNFATTANINTYTWPADTSANVIIIKWDLSTISTSASITDATLQLYMDSMGDGGGDALYDIPVHKITGVNPGISTCTWDTPWTSPGGQSDIALPEDTNSMDKTLGYKSWSVTDMVQDWVSNPQENRGMLLNSDSSASTDSNRLFSSSDSTSIDQRPKLVITYSTSQTYHRADTHDPFGCVDTQEILAFISHWHYDSTAYPMSEMMEGVTLWKSGEGCS